MQNKPVSRSKQALTALVCGALALTTLVIVPSAQAQDKPEPEIELGEEIFPEWSDPILVPTFEPAPEIDNTRPGPAIVTYTPELPEFEADEDPNEAPKFDPRDIFEQGEEVDPEEPTATAADLEKLKAELQQQRDIGEKTIAETERKLTAELTKAIGELEQDARKHADSCARYLDAASIEKLGTCLAELGKSAPATRSDIAARGMTCAGRPATIVSANTVIIGTPGPDVIVATDKFNVIHGLGGNDFICGRGGVDFIFGGQGRDTILGESGTDIIFGGDHKDVMNGNDGIDVLFGGRGNDIVRGSGGFDLLFGGAGNDRMSGGSGPDLMWGNEGNDSLAGNGSVDLLRGGSGHDSLFGGGFIDFMYGNSGNDYMLGGDWGDFMYGQDGYDYMRADSGWDYANGGNGNDQIWGGRGWDIVLGKSGNDALRGDRGSDWISGGNGNSDWGHGNRGWDYCTRSTEHQNSC